MNFFKNILISIWIPFSLSGCLYGQCMDGPCALERERLIRNIKPYGAHWIKDGMTKEQRREDSWACGAARTTIGADGPVFDDDQIEKERLPEDKNDIGPNGRLTRRWGACMQSKGYVFLKECDSRCMYP